MDNVLFATEMFGAVNATDPQTGRNFEDIVPLFQAIDWLSDDDRYKITEGNARKVYSRMHVGASPSTPVKGAGWHRDSPRPPAAAQPAPPLPHFLPSVANGVSPSSLVMLLNHWMTSLCSGIPCARRSCASSYSDRLQSTRS